MSTAGRIRRIFSADVDKFIIERVVYDDFGFWLGSQFKDAYLEREGWTIYVTNLCKEEFSAQSIHQIYAQRWGIEIQFRALKSQANLQGLLNKRVKHKVHLEILLQAIMILAQLTAKMHYTLKKSLCKKKATSLSIE